MRAVGDAQGLIEMLVHHDAAFSERDPQMRGLYLKDEALKGDGVVMTHGTLFFDGEDEIKVHMILDGDKSGPRLLGLNGEALVKSADVGFFQESIRSFFGLDAMQSKLITEPALKGFIDALSTAPGFRGISRDGPNAQLCQGLSDLGQMAFLDLLSGLRDRKSTRLNSSHSAKSRMPSSA